MTSRQRSQSIVEFAITIPVFMLVVFVTIELALVLFSYYSETRMARETGRWLAVHSATTNDQELADHVLQTMLPGLIKADWRNNAAENTTGTTATASHYRVGNMTVDFTSCMAASSGGAASTTAVCDNANRVAGSTLYVQMSYNVSNLLFLPTTFRIGSLQTTLPTSLPPYKVSVMVE